MSATLLHMQPGEHKLVDVTAPLRALTFPALELLLYSALLWMLIGWVDAKIMAAHAHNALVIAWVVLVLWRFIAPLRRLRQSRFIVTNTRVIARTGRVIDSIPLTDIAEVRRRRGGISLAIHGYQRPLHFPKLPATKAIEHAIAGGIR